MEASRKRDIKSGAEYDHLFPRATVNDITVKKGATVEDTVRFIPKVVKMHSWQTQAFTDHLLRGLSRYEACKKLWQFLYDHIAYKKDKLGLEQIRTARRSWHDRFTGIDCDCYSTFISMVLTNLGIPHTLRIAKYSQDYFQHIYPIVPMPDGSYITIDCVVNEFNYEEPYTEIKDTQMDLQLLDGIDDDKPAAESEEIYGIEEDKFGQLGWSLKKAVKKVGKAASKATSFVGKKVIAKGAAVVAKATVKAAKFTAKNAVKGVHLLNKINPATLLLRNGLLAALKLNMFNVSKDLRFSYLNPQETQKRGLNPSKVKSLTNIRKKLESILYAAGGEASALKSSILKGKGNSGKDKVLAGLEGIEDTDFAALQGMDESTPLYQLLGPEIFNSTNVITEADLHGIREMEMDGLEGVEGTRISDSFYVGQELTGLGEPATLSLAAASGALATIAGLIKNIGSVYQKGKAIVEKVKPIAQVAKGLLPSKPSASSQSSPEAQPEFAEAIAPPAPSEPSPSDAETQPTAMVPDEPDGQPPEADTDEPTTEKPAAQSTEVATTSSMLPAVQQTQVQAVTPAAETGFWDKNKKWLKPTLIGMTGIGIVYLGFKMFSGTKAKPPASKPVQGLSGLKGKKKKPKRKPNKIQPISLS